MNERPNKYGFEHVVEQLRLFITSAVRSLALGTLVRAQAYVEYVPTIGVFA